MLLDASSKSYCRCDVDSSELTGISSIVFWNIIFCIGNIVQITTVDHWYQMAVGRLVAGLGVGGLSVLTPMYQAETAPRQVRGALISAYQLFITLGIFIAYCINFGTESDVGSRQWKLPIGISFLWPVIMAIGILFFPESPRWEYRRGKVDSARHTISLSYGVSENHTEVRREMHEIQRKFEAEQAGGGAHKFYEIFTAPAMGRRVMIGVVLQALQQLTGANFFFYYGTSIFTATGLSNSYVTSIILGGVNFGTTFFGLYVAERFGRRKSLIAGGLWMFMCFLVRKGLSAFPHSALTRIAGLRIGRLLRIRPRLPREHALCRRRNDRLRMPLHRRLRHNLGLPRMGCGGRDLPYTLPRKVYRIGNRQQLDLEFSHLLLHAVHHERHRLPLRIRVCEHVFHGRGVCVLLRLRVAGQVAGGYRYHVRPGC